MMTIPPLKTYTFVPVTGQIICRSVAVDSSETTADETTETPNKGKKRPAESSSSPKAAETPKSNAKRLKKKKVKG